MSINNDYYQQIINNYPEYVSKEVFYKIAHISKRTAQYLLQSKKVPCTESDKKTRKYKIKVLDIVTYLIDRELRPEYYLPRCSKKNISSVSSFLHTQMDSLNENEMGQFRFYLINEFNSLKDILTVKEVASILKMSCKTISRKCTKGEVFSFLIDGKRLIPKISIIDYLASVKGICLIGKSSTVDALVETYIKNKNSMTML